MPGRLVGVLLVSLFLQATMLLEPTKAEKCKNTPVDVVFVLDESSSIHPPDFRKQKTFVQNLIDRLDVGPEGSHVGVETFDESVKVILELNEINDVVQLKQRIGEISQRHGPTTRTDRALIKLREMFGSKNARRGFKQVAIVITDGKSDYETVTASAAKLVHDDGVTVFAIGVGKDADKSELENIASDGKYVFTVESYDKLDKLLSILDIKDCHDKPTPCPQSGKKLWNEFARRGLAKSAADLFDY